MFTMDYKELGLTKEDLVERCARYLTIKTNDILATKKAIFDSLKVGKMILSENDELMLFEYDDDLQSISKFIIGNCETT